MFSHACSAEIFVGRSRTGSDPSHHWLLTPSASRLKYKPPGDSPGPVVAHLCLGVNGGKGGVEATCPGFQSEASKRLGVQDLSMSAE